MVKSVWLYLDPFLRKLPNEIRKIQISLNNLRPCSFITTVARDLVLFLVCIELSLQIMYSANKKILSPSEVGQKLGQSLSKKKKTL